MTPFKTIVRFQFYAEQPMSQQGIITGILFREKDPFAPDFLDVKGTCGNALMPRV